jgi:hypothetical protein
MQVEKVVKKTYVFLREPGEKREIGVESLEFSTFSTGFSTAEGYLE